MLYLPGEIGQRKIGCLDRRKQPRVSRGGEGFDFLRLGVCWLSADWRSSRRWSSEGLHPRWFGAFLNPYPVVDRQVAELLHQSARPANRGAHWAVCGSQAEEDILAVLRKKSRSCLH